MSSWIGFAGALQRISIVWLERQTLRWPIRSLDFAAMPFTFWRSKWASGCFTPTIEWLETGHMTTYESDQDKGSPQGSQVLWKKHHLLYSPFRASLVQKRVRFTQRSIVLIFNMAHTACLRSTLMSVGFGNEWQLMKPCAYGCTCTSSLAKQRYEK